MENNQPDDLLAKYKIDSIQNLNQIHYPLTNIKCSTPKVVEDPLPVSQNVNEILNQQKDEPSSNSEGKHSIRLQRFTGILPSLKTMNEPFGTLSQLFYVRRLKAEKIYKSIYLPHIFSESRASTTLELLKSHEEDVLRTNQDIVNFITLTIKQEIDPKVATQKELGDLLDIIHDLQAASLTPHSRNMGVQEAIIKAYTKVIKAYTKDTFLYYKINSYLRNEDWDGMINLLPYTLYLLSAFSELEYEDRELGLLRGSG